VSICCVCGVRVKLDRRYAEVIEEGRPKIFCSKKCWRIFHRKRLHEIERRKEM